MDTRRLALFQRQIETVFKMSLTDLDLRIKKLFPELRIKSHVTGAGIRKWDGYAPSQLLFVLINLVLLNVNSIHDLMNLRFVYDHTQRRTANGYEMITVGLITPTNFSPLGFGYRFSTRRYEQTQEATVCEPTGSLAKGIASSYLLVDAWFAAPSRFENI